MISYTVTVCNEHRELDRLLTLLVQYCKESDEIVVQLDQNNNTLEVRDVLKKFEENVVVTEFPLNGDFATYKNHLQNFCTKKWIFNIDADEIPSETLLTYLHAILDNNESLDVLIVPRANTVDGIQEEHIKKWGWRVDADDRINWPDYQMRIFKNTPQISWVGKVHEVLTGYQTYTFLPADEAYCLYHPKTIDRQERQNELYSTIGTT